jgi:hypothetical protein
MEQDRRTLPIADLHEMTEHAGTIGVSLIPVITFPNRDLTEIDGVPASVGDDQEPASVPAIGSGPAAVGDEIPAFASRTPAAALTFGPVLRMWRAHPW